MTDPITVAVLQNRLNAIAEEMGEALVRASYSTNIKERRDCSTALFDTEGNTLCQAEHIPMHLGSFIGLLPHILKRHPVEEMRLVLSESHERPFNWKVLLENYSENYHTPFVHPEIDTSNTHDYPMVADGVVLYAWDRPLRPTTEAGRVMAELLPGEPGWEVLGQAPTAVPYDVGSYLTIWPNLMLNVFPDACLAMWVAPVAPNRTVVHRRLFAHPSASAEAVAAQLEAHRLVHQQDVDVCAAVQRTHDAGIDADGAAACLSPDRTLLYVADAESHWVYSSSLAPNGAITNRQRYYHLHVPDDADDAGAEEDLLRQGSHDRVPLRTCTRGSP